MIGAELSPLTARFPRTLEALLALPDGRSTLEHLLLLERSFAHQSDRSASGSAAAPRIVISDDGPRSGAMDYDVALAGGGLSLIYGAYLARAGYKVAIFDRGRIGRGHREWNISRAELAPLADSGLLSDEELKALVLCEYERGIVRWHGGATYPVRGVLDAVLDAQALLDRLRALAEDAGATLLDGHRLAGYRTGRAGVAIDLLSQDTAPTGSDGTARTGTSRTGTSRTGTSRTGTTRTITARLLIDGMGAASPHAHFDLVCPTVGGVLDGLDLGDADDLLDPRVGEILVSTEGVEERRQHIWEGFPAPARVAGAASRRSTIYLFYYCEPDTLGEHPLLSLYERFFRLRPRYKRGEAILEKATYGFIPAHTRLRPTPASPSARVILVGDAAGRHSPLTFCGFGSMIRSFRPVADGLRRLLETDSLSRRSLEAVWAEPESLRLLGALALMMIPPGARGSFGPPSGDSPSDGGARGGDGRDEINRLLDTAFGVLASMGEPIYAAMVRDEIGFRDFARFMLRTAKLRPSIYREVFSHLSPAEIAVWSWHFSSLAARSLV